MSVVDRVRQEHPHHEAITILNWAFPSTFPTVPVVVHHPRRDRSFGPSSLPCSISTDGCHKLIGQYRVFDSSPERSDTLPLDIVVYA